MKLELKHLAPYSAFGLKVVVSDTQRNLTAVSIDSPFVYVDSYKGSREKQMVYVHHIKPILRPLSDLTKEIEEGKKPIAEWLMLCKNSKGVWSFDTNDFSTWEVMAVINEVNLLFKNHFDVFGLIEKGLAIDINTLPQNKL